MYLQLDQLQVHYIIYLLQMINNITNGEILMQDSIHLKNQEIIGLLNKLVKDIGLLNLLLIQINSYLDYKMKEMVKNSQLEHIHLLKKEINGLLMDLMDEYYKSLK